MKFARFQAKLLLAALVSAAACGSVTSAAPAQAAESIDKEQARALFQEAVALVTAGDYASALGKLQRVASFKRTPQVQYYLALCHEKLGKLVMALGEFRLALADAQQMGAADVAREARAAINALEPRIPTLTVDKGAGAGSATITIDGREIGDVAIGQAMPLNPGVHVIEARAAGYKPYRQEVRLQEAEKASITVKLEPEPAAAATPDGQQADDRDDNESSPPIAVVPPESSGSSKALGWVVTGIGVASLATSGVFYYKRSTAIEDLDGQCGAGGMNCPASAKDVYDTGKRDTMIANVALGVGAVGLVSGIVLLATSGGSEPEKPAQADRAKSVRVSPAAPGSFAGLSFSGRF